MTEPKRWTPTRYDGVAMAPSTRGRYVNGLDYDALAADFDRLRDERDRLRKELQDTLIDLKAWRKIVAKMPEYERVADRDRCYAEVVRLRDERDRLFRERNEACGWASSDAEAAREARRVAGVLAGALRECLDHHAMTLGEMDAARSALAVFDTLTEEKTARAREGDTTGSNE